MAYEVSVRQVTQQPLAVIRDRATRAELASKIPSHCGTVWNFIKRAGLRSSGRMIAVYLDQPDETLLLTNDGAPIEVGAQVDEPFSDSPPVVCSSSPAGTVAVTVHIGPYSDLPKAHAAVRDWCKQSGRQIAGTNWELYGHGTDDVAEMSTDLFYLLR